MAAIVFISSIWLNVRGMDGEATARHAAIEDASRPTADLILVLASVASLIAVGLALLEASSRRGFGEGDHHGRGRDHRHPVLGDRPHGVHLRSARFHYAAGGGIDFHEDRPPAYGDFACLAFTIGMTYQVSDTTTASRAIRRTVLYHAYMSYIFGTVVVAMTINVVASLLNR
jgi:uncharacterized membrane protein